MARQISMAAQFPPIAMLANAADAAGRTGSYRSLRNAEKAWLVVRVNQGNAAPVAITPQQAQDISGTGAKAINAVPIWSNLDTVASDALVSRTAAASYTTDAGVKDKIVIFEIMPETALDLANGFNHIAAQTGASNAANITSAELFIWGKYQQATPPTAYV